jgi:uncharacterized NAD-dependent epimerase/dehydratase family protein
LLNKIYCNTPAIFLAHGYVGEMLGKTINGVLMHSELFDVVALVDRNRVGQDTGKICPGVTKKVPIYATVEDAITHQPQVMILVGDPGEENMAEIKFCTEKGLDVINSSFTFLKNFPDLVSLANKRGARLIDLRNIQRKFRDVDGGILNIKAKVVFVTGTDCGLGKRTATYELVNEAKRRGINAGFAATGQTGLMIGCDGGIIFDAITAQFLAGSVEELIVDLNKKNFELIFLEGQGSVMHFGTSCVITLLHASNPHAIVAVHDPQRVMHAGYPDSPIFKMCELEREIEIIEKLSLPGGNKFKVTALATIGKENIRTLEKISDLPVADTRQPGGAGILLDAVLKHLQKEYRWRPQNLRKVLDAN